MASLYGNHMLNVRLKKYHCRDGFITFGCESSKIERFCIVLGALWKGTHASPRIDLSPFGSSSPPICTAPHSHSGRPPLGVSFNKPNNMTDYKIVRTGQNDQICFRYPH